MRGSEDAPCRTGQPGCCQHHLAPHGHNVDDGHDDYPCGSCDDYDDHPYVSEALSIQYALLLTLHPGSQRCRRPAPVPHAHPKPVRFAL
jgi:hypothetical protein